MAAPESANESASAAATADAPAASALRRPAGAGCEPFRYRVRRLARVLFLALGPLVVLTVGGFWYATSGASCPPRTPTSRPSTSS